MATALQYLPSRIFSCAIFAAGGAVVLMEAVKKPGIGDALQGIGLMAFAAFMFLRPVLLRGSQAPSGRAAGAGTDRVRANLFRAGVGLYAIGVLLRFIFSA